MITYGDAELVAREANFRWGSNVNKHDVMELLEYGNTRFLEPYEREAIIREAHENGVW